MPKEANIDLTVQSPYVAVHVIDTYLTFGLFYSYNSANWHL